MITGDVVVTYSDGTEEHCVGGRRLLLAAGHSVRVDTDAELILFSPQAAHGEVIDHIARQDGAGLI